MYVKPHFNICLVSVLNIILLWDTGDWLEKFLPVAIVFSSIVIVILFLDIMEIVDLSIGHDSTLEQRLEDWKEFYGDDIRGIKHLTYTLIQLLIFISIPVIFGLFLLIIFKEFFSLII